MEPESRPPSSRPSFTAFWKRTKDAASAAAKQVTFVSGSVSGRGKGRNKFDKADPYACGDDSSSEDDGEDGIADIDGSAAASGSTLTKAQLRRAQVRRAQVQHRKRKADYLRQLEVDVNTLRDLIADTERDSRKLRRENDNIRMRLGISSTRGSSSGGAGGSNIGIGDVTLDVPAVTGSTPDDAAVGGGVPQLVFSSAPDTSPTATASWDTSTTTTGPSPTTISSSTSPAAQWGIPIAATETTDAKVDSTGSLFADIDLDDIIVTLEMDEMVGTPVYRISSSSVSSSSPSYGENSTTLQFPASSVSPAPFFNPVTTSATTSTTMPPSLDLALDPVPMTEAVPANNSGLVLPGYPEMPEMTIDQVHMAFNFILALEHVCWNHAGHQFCSPIEGLPHAGHTLMASNLLLRHAPTEVHEVVNASNDKIMREQLSQTSHSHDTADSGGNDGLGSSITWKARDVSLQSLYGLATSLNPSADKELTPVQAWFDMASRYPLSVLLRQDVLGELKRGFTGVVRCLYFGAVMEREAYESVVSRILNPIVVAETASSGL